MNIVIIGLSITSSWGNGHATTYRSLIKALSGRGHSVLFLEQDVPYYAKNRDMPDPHFCELALYSSREDLERNYYEQVRDADVVIVGSYVQEGVDVGEWVISTTEGVAAFYDIDTPVTLAKLKRGDHEYINPDLVAKYDLYLSFSGGPVLDYLEEELDSPAARPLYCSVDPSLYYPIDISTRWKMGYLGTYSKDRQPKIEKFLINAAKECESKKFVVAGPQYPKNIEWPENIERIEHLPPNEHCRFYNAQEFTLNVTRADMVEAGYSPSVRLFEAAACGVPVISDKWNGIEDFFEPESEIILVGSTGDVLSCLLNMDREEAKQIGANAREKVLKYHTAEKRAEELEHYVKEVKEGVGRSGVQQAYYR